MQALHEVLDVVGRELPWVLWEESHGLDPALNESRRPAPQCRTRHEPEEDRSQDAGRHTGMVHPWLPTSNLTSSDLTL